MEFNEVHYWHGCEGFRGYKAAARAWFSGSYDFLHGNVYTKVYVELINFATSYSRFIAMLFYGLADIKM